MPLSRLKSVNSKKGRWFVLNGVVSLFGWFVVHKLSLKV
ncbi:Uncharacterised protein [Vibrio cholerae]|nr:Uncharacterised protein [Vibrio cholerae]CSI91219.1 Uncharacterised protein [Vibrio cholerae]